jgi:hypothetical protein
VKTYSLQKETIKDERKVSYLYPSQALETIRQGGILHTNFPFTFLIKLQLHELAQLNPNHHQLPPSHSLISSPSPSPLPQSRVNNPALSGCAGTLPRANHLSASRKRELICFKKRSPRVNLDAMHCLPAPHVCGRAHRYCRYGFLRVVSCVNVQPYLSNPHCPATIAAIPASVRRSE